MKHLISFLAAALIASSCTLRSIPNQPALNDNQRTTTSQPISPTDMAEISHRLQKLKNQHPNGFSTQASPKYSYKGIPHHRHIDDFSEAELLNASPDELSVVVKDKSSIDVISANLYKMGYKSRLLGGDTLVIKLSESGPSALRKHFKILDKTEGLFVVLPRIKYFPLLKPNDEYINFQDSYLQAINAYDAWSHAGIQNSYFIIAILDSGISPNHVDISAKLISGKDVTPTSSFWPYYWPDYHDPSDTTDYSYNSHGTGVAAVAAAATNNNKGIAGAGWGSFVAAYVIDEDPDSDGGIYGDNIRAGIEYSIQDGVNVINLSVGGPDD